MTLGEYIKAKRAECGLDERKFAYLCGIPCHVLIGLEQGEDSTTKAPVELSVCLLNKLALGMRMSTSALCDQVEDIPIDIRMRRDEFFAWDPDTDILG